MKKAALLLGIVLSFAFAVQAQDGEATDGPKMVFENETIDYGVIEHNSNGEREFVFTNNGNQPLIITNARGSCGCTVPTWPKEPIAPGAQGSIKVKYATNRVGKFTKTVTLTSNDGSSGTKILTIKGEVKPPAPEEEAFPEKQLGDGVPVEN